MTRALEEAGVVGVDYVHAHATDTVQGDAAEVEAITRLTAKRGIPDITVSSHKGALGHLLHASAFPGLVAAIGAIRDGLLPTTIGLREPLLARGSTFPSRVPLPSRPGPSSTSSCTPSASAAITRVSYSATLLRFEYGVF
ncbi:MAG: hypothetical protein B5766_00905 [Candidatus Lumbricidophila eiseniae]|uniref:Beta-ketoacyl synthase C-terminal domain-containing protein n=1 Tax=Candidatus Lumbricidiphila eiseniae TaxID=1969409 RepID=A0A2A6FU47_9MICO|nr:MAG: hypothetical protein B5766_00905 [Candidatus Lumbricidophila eiseniae]